VDHEGGAHEGVRRRSHDRARGAYNVVDDEPAPVREWLPFLAEQIGAKKPMRVPRFLGRLLAGEAPVLQMTEARGGSNAKAKRELGWQPRWSTWRIGFAKGLGDRKPGSSRHCLVSADLENDRFREPGGSLIKWPVPPE
jgi:hypothetical protein